MDLEFVLSVISDGPTKSLAYRRLQYLTSKFDMYYLLNEYQEVADMKVGGFISWLLLSAHNIFNRKSPTGILIPSTALCVIL